MKKTVFAAMVSAALSFHAEAADLDIQIINLTHGSYFTPLLIAAHDNNTHLFQAGQAA